MSSRGPDQAEGLRRLLAREALRVLSVNAGGSGDSAAIINLAAALAELGRDVLILDEKPPAQGVSAALGLRPRYGLEHVIRRERELDDIILRGPGGLRVLPLARGARALAQLPASEQQRLIEHCGGLGIPVDTLLVDPDPGSARALCSSGSAAQEVVVLAGGGAAAITAAYALIKRLSGEFARREFHLLVAEVASAAEARTIFRNMAQAARRYLQVSLHFLGHVAPDDKLRRAAQLRLPVVTAFPRTQAAADFRCMAQAISGWPRADAEGSGFDDFMRCLIHSSGVHACAAATSI